MSRHLAELCIVCIGGHGLRRVAELCQIPLPHILQECKGYAPAKLLRAHHLRWCFPHTLYIPQAGWEHCRRLPMTYHMDCMFCSIPESGMSRQITPSLFSSSESGAFGQRAHLICHTQESDAIPDHYVEEMPLLGIGHPAAHNRAAMRQEDILTHCRCRQHLGNEHSREDCGGVLRAERTESTCHLGTASPRSCGRQGVHSR